MLCCNASTFETALSRYDVLTISFPSFNSAYDNSYSFSSPTDDWPSVSSTESTLDAASAAAVKSHMRKGPLRSIKRVAGRFKDILVQ